MYTLIESHNIETNTNVDQVIDNKITLLEYLTKQIVNTEEVKEDVLIAFQTYYKELRILTYKVLLEKLNSNRRYS